jgi:hypothetical protein
MGFKDFLFGYGRGRDIGRGQSVIQSTPVTLAGGPPSSLSGKSLTAVCSIVPTGDENLIITRDYVVYKTDYEFINAVLKCSSPHKLVHLKIESFLIRSNLTGGHIHEAEAIFAPTDYQDSQRSRYRGNKH